MKSQSDFVPIICSRTAQMLTWLTSCRSSWHPDIVWPSFQERPLVNVTGTPSFVLATLARGKVRGFRKSP